MDSIKVAKDFAHALANKLLPLHGRINLLKMQREPISKEQLSNLERIAEAMIALNSDFRNKLEEESKFRESQPAIPGLSPDSQSNAELIELTYSSECNFSKQQVNRGLLGIAEESQQKNKTNRISGFLLYRNGYFVQRIEGPATAVDALYGKICLDPRHKNICLLSRYPISAPHFENWEMLKVMPIEDANKAASIIDRFKNSGWDKISEAQSFALAQVVMDI